ncbi:MAG: hypothetical protein Q9227_001380 [Pyrenula ochraceoflavens]
MGSIQTEKISLTSLAESLLEAAKTYESSTKAKDDPLHKAEIIKTAGEIAKQVKDPRHLIFEYYMPWAEGYGLRALLQLGVFENIPQKGSISSKELSEKTGADESLIIRLMRLPVLHGIFESPQLYSYAHTPYSQVYTSEGAEGDFFKLMVDNIYAATSRLPAFFSPSAHGPHDITDNTHIPLAWANNTYPMNGFNTMKTIPGRVELFNRAMPGHDFLVPVLGMYPYGPELSPLITPSTSPSQPLLVDIGGGLGDTLLQIKDAYPSHLGSAPMLLQDMPHVLAQAPTAKLSSHHISTLAHDFFTPQPVRNASAYLIRRCLHNWTHDMALTLLRHTVEAMGPDSRLLINEMAVPESEEEIKRMGADYTVFWLDHAMMCFGGRERTVREFEGLLGEVGVEVVRVWWAESGCQCVVEGRKKVS